MDEPADRVDTVGLRCPLPLFHAREAMLDIAPGRRIEVLSDDPQAPSDFERWAPQHGHTLVAVTAKGRTFHILLEKGPDG